MLKTKAGIYINLATVFRVVITRDYYHFYTDTSANSYGVPKAALAEAETNKHMKLK